MFWAGVKKTWRRCWHVGASRSKTLSSSSVEEITKRGRAACWSVPRWWQDGPWDVSSYVPHCSGSSGRDGWPRWRNCHGDESAQRATVFVQTKARWFTGRNRDSSLFFRKAQDAWSTEPGQVWVYLGIGLCSGYKSGAECTRYKSVQLLNQKKKRHQQTKWTVASGLCKWRQ